MPVDKDNLLTHVEQLTKYAQNGDIEACNGIIDALGKCELTVDILKSTKIGLHLRSVAKTETTPAEVQKRCKQLVKRWRNEFVVQPGTEAVAAAPSPVALQGHNQKRKLSDASSATSSPAVKRRLSKQILAPKLVPRDVATLRPPAIGKTGDLTRDKCRMALWKALNAFELNDGDRDTKTLAEEIESAIHGVCAKDGGISQYKLAIKSKCSNLKDAKNNLRLRVLNGTVPPKMLAKMSACDMATDELKKQNIEHKKAGMNDALAPQNTGSTTDAFKCGKCGKRKCTYYEKQTRSADEPMTVFVTCTVCGNKWRC